MSVMGLKVEWHYWEAAVGGPVTSAALHSFPRGAAAESTCLWNSRHHAVTEERGPPTHLSPRTLTSAAYSDRQHISFHQSLGFLFRRKWEDKPGDKHFNLACLESSVLTGQLRIAPLLPSHQWAHICYFIVRQNNNNNNNIIIIIIKISPRVKRLKDGLGSQHMRFWTWGRARLMPVWGGRYCLPLDLGLAPRVVLV